MIDVIVFAGVFLATYRLIKVAGECWESIKTQRYYNRERAYIGLTQKPLTLRRTTR